MSLPTIHIKKPRRPIPGDTIGIVAPASPFNKEKFIRGILKIKALGFSVVFPETIYECNGYLAGADSLRANNLNAMFADPNVNGIFCARGGYGTLRILSLIDFGLIATNPKLFIGCSDITTLLNAIYDRCGLVCFHGPMVESLADASERTIQSLGNLFTTHQALTVIPESRVVIKEGQATGALAGGNLTTLCHLVGTPYEPDLSGKIVLLEDVGESPYRIDRMLTHLMLAGCFDDIRGMVLGSFTGCGKTEVIYRIFDEIFSCARFPILAGFAVGHDEPNLTVPFGIAASIDTDRKGMTFDEQPFC